MYTKIPRCLFPLLMIGFLAGYSNPVKGEEVLYKRRAKYLGWKTAIGKFTTCSKERIDIGDGRIEKTEVKCEEPTWFGPWASGTVQYVDVRYRTFGIKDERGKWHDIFFPEGAEVAGDVRLNDLNIGDKVTVSGPVRGRAEIIWAGK